MKENNKYITTPIKRIILGIIVVVVSTVILGVMIQIVSIAAFA
jgi:hypothetical protein